jgi:anaerobic magnesium-protoporphyrin IX monomethyl ester cyclase
MTVDLIYPASSSGSENYSSEAPLGPIAIYSSLPIELRKNVRFLDSTIMSEAEIESAVSERRASIVALSCTTFNYGNAIRLAQLAKENGSTVILGGIHITYLRDSILAKMLRGGRPYDYLISSYGEPAFPALLTAIANGSSVREIPNLSFCKDEEIVVNRTVSPRFGGDPLTIPLDYAAMDFDEYSRRFQPFGNLRTARIQGSTFTQRGCAYAGSQKCTFCSIEQINPRRAADLFEQDIVTLVSQHNVDHVRVTDGDFTTDIRHMTRMADAAERAFEKTGRRPLFHCFARADEIDAAKIKVLKRMNVVSVFIGYESGSDQMLRAMHKFTTSEQNLQATRLLKEQGIDVICAGLVLGGEGESEETLQETLRFVRALKAIGNTHSLVATPLIPLPGSPSFTQLIEKLAKDDPSKSRQLAIEDDFDIQELVELWNKAECRVSLHRVMEVSEEIAVFFRMGIRLVKMANTNGRPEVLAAATA